MKSLAEEVRDTVDRVIKAGKPFCRSDVIAAFPGKVKEVRSGQSIGSSVTTELNARKEDGRLVFFGVNDKGHNLFGLPGWPQVTPAEYTEGAASPSAGGEAAHQDGGGDAAMASTEAPPPEETGAGWVAGADASAPEKPEPIIFSPGAAMPMPKKEFTDPHAAARQDLPPGIRRAVEVRYVVEEDGSKHATLDEALDAQRYARLRHEISLFVDNRPPVLADISSMDIRAVILAWEGR